MAGEMTLIEVVNTFQDEESAEQFFIGARWPDGIACPKCGSVSIYKCTNRKPMPFRCDDCHKYFSVKSGSLMHGSPLPLSKWALAIYLVVSSNKGIPSIRLGRDVGVTQRTAWHMAHRIREGLDSGDPMFKGPVEVDETYVGGSDSNRHSNKKLREKAFSSKTVVVGVKDRETKHVKAAVISSPTVDNLVEFVHSNVESVARTPVYTDGLQAYDHLWTFDHRSVNHSVGQYVDGDAHTNGIEAFWSMIKRGVMGVYHYLSPKHTHRYALEFEWRNNARADGLSMMDQITSVMAGMVGKRLTYRQLVGRRGHALPWQANYFDTQPTVAKGHGIQIRQVGRNQSDDRKWMERVMA